MQRDLSGHGDGSGGTVRQELPLVGRTLVGRWITAIARQGRGFGCDGGNGEAAGSQVAMMMVMAGTIAGCYTIISVVMPVSIRVVVPGAMPKI